jgi:hypothetical protein
MMVHPAPPAARPAGAACCAALAVLTLTAADATAAQATTAHVGAPVVTTDDGAVRGVIAAPSMSSSANPVPSRRSATCAGVPPLRRPAGTVSARPRAVLSLVPPQPRVETDITVRHHCSLWAAG